MSDRPDHRPYRLLTTLESPMLRGNERNTMASVQKTAMRTFAALNISVYRASRGRLMGKVRGVPVLLLTVAGRKTGVLHTSPVVYVEDDGRYVVAGSAGGSVAEPQWFRNLRSAGEASIEVGPRRVPVTVIVAEGEERAVLWPRLVSRAPFFADYQAKVSREIPLAVLTPIPVSDSA